MTSVKLAYNAIEDYLGPRHMRFFGDGYRRVDYTTDDIEVLPGLHETNLHTLVSLTYPVDWSRKGDQIDLKPHLSSIDTLLLGVQSSVMYIAHIYGLLQDIWKNVTVIKVFLRAGPAPQEDLVGIPLSLKWRETSVVPGEGNKFVSICDCQIGLMFIRCVIEHPLVKMMMTPLSCPSFDSILGSASTRYYGDGFKHWYHSITDIHVDMETLDATAKVSIASTDTGDGCDELPTYPISMLDCFLVTLQLAQVMMYELDSVERQNSNTLWMIQTRMNLASDEHYPTSDEQCHFHVRSKHLLPLRGAMWRNLDIAGTYGGIDSVCSIAHALPNSSPS